MSQSIIIAELNWISREHKIKESQNNSQKHKSETFVKEAHSS